MNDLLVIAQIAGRRCALPALNVQSVIEVGTITPVPRSPAYVAGITALRSQTLTVIDCRTALGFDPDQWPCDHRAVVVPIEAHPYALIIDRIEDVTTTVGELGQVPGGFGTNWARIATGMIETRIGPALLIDVHALIAPLEELGSAA
ncbi:MAG: chemotaxis protein CheW [Erythrobacter sp.]|jgi:purine-binding chemotaxis protein CheW|nr:chemotaxis protein CheW [Erythrobacter sp.]